MSLGRSNKNTWINDKNSELMRSLVKVAQEKGLVKPEPLPVRTAASFVKNDLSPTNNLMENIVKLCQGLRTTGFNKYADELESVFINYKQATTRTLYDTTGEKGEDLIDAAHPKGSHKMEGVEGDAVVETILDKHIKMLDVTNKKPTGKLASSQDIINAVKIVLADDSDVENFQEKIANVNSILDKSIGNVRKTIEYIVSQTSLKDTGTLTKALEMGGAIAVTFSTFGLGAASIPAVISSWDTFKSDIQSASNVILSSFQEFKLKKDRVSLDEIVENIKDLRSKLSKFKILEGNLKETGVDACDEALTACSNAINIFSGQSGVEGGRQMQSFTRGDADSLVEQLKNTFGTLKQRIEKAKEKIVDLQWDQARQSKANDWFGKFLANLKIQEDIFNGAKNKENVATTLSERLKPFNEALSKIENGIK